jgi:hypothetical protein
VSAYTTTDRSRVLAMLRGGALLPAVVAATGIHDNTVRAWARRAGVTIPTMRRKHPSQPPPPPSRVIPIAGCEHFRMGHRTLCTACYCAVQRGEAVLG